MHSTASAHWWTRTRTRPRRAITQLSAILRNAMATVKRNLVPLGEEIDIVKAYLELERMRYEERLRIHFDLFP
jgi:two-component system LytT family sensor kinase